MRYYNRMQVSFTSANFLLAPLHFHSALRADLLHPGVRRKNVATFTKTHRALRVRPRHQRRLFSSCAVRSGRSIFVIYSYLVSHATTERTVTLLHRFRRLLRLLRGAGEPALHGRPVGVIPFEGARNNCVIAANAAAKRVGARTGTPIAEARRLCPQIALPATCPSRPG